MRLWVITGLTAAALFAADEQRLALEFRAQLDFERVQLAATPELRGAIACTQTQAALIPVSAPSDLALVHYRKGFCILAGATITRNGSEFMDAAGEFDKALDAWPARVLNTKKGVTPEPIPSALRVLGTVARLEAGVSPEGGVNNADLERAFKEISSAVEPPVCPAGFMSPTFCGTVLETGRQWLGWMALRQDGLSEAAQDFSGATGTGWPEWVAGRKAFRDGQYKESAHQYRQAVGLARQAPSASLAERLGPRPDFPSELVELGGAQFLSGDNMAAIATFDEAIKLTPANARALYLRARAKETAGQNDAALADYNLASRTAFANAKDLASGEAHLYRGILLYRRKDFSHAEDEFASALNFEITGAMRADAVSWRHLAAVAAGSCDASRQYLERSLAAASPYFPKAEARTALATCRSTAAIGPPGGIP